MPNVNVTEPAILIRIAKLYRDEMSPVELYEATRGVWKVGVNRELVQLAFAVAKGIVRDVYDVESWHPAGTTDYATRPAADVQINGRWEFTGKLAIEAIRKSYIGKSVKHYFPTGSSNPVCYVNIEI